MTSSYGDMSGTGEDTGTPLTGSTSGSLVELGDSTTAENIVSRARNVRDDFHFGDDRAITVLPNYNAQDSTQLYNSAVNNNDPGSAEGTAQAWTKHGRDLEDAADALYKAITDLAGAWVGEASGAAQAALIGVANASSTAGDAARTMGRRMSEQAHAAAEVKKMPPPKEFNYDAELAKLLSGHPAAMSAEDFNDKVSQANAVKAEQVAYMNAYTNTMSAIDGSTPSFGPDSIGLKPTVGSYGGSGTGNLGNVGVGDAGPTLSDVRGHVGAAASTVSAGGPMSHTGTPGPGGLGVGNVGVGNVGAGNISVGDLGQVNPLSGQAVGAPITTSGVVPVSTTDSGPGLGVGLGAAAVGAGVGFAGARALAKGSRFQKKKDDPRAQETAEQQATAEQAAQTEATGPGQQPGQQAPPPVQQPGQQAPAGASQHTPGSPQQTYGTSSQGYAAQHYPAPGQPVGYASAPSQPQPLAEGAVMGAGDPAAQSQVTAASNQQPASGVQPGAQPGSGPVGQAGGSAATPGGSAQAGAVPAAGPMAPMAPMGGAAGAGAGGGDMAAGGGTKGSGGGSGSYLIQPDPDDIFGATEVAAQPVIGAFDEDDD